MPCRKWSSLPSLTLRTLSCPRAGWKALGAVRLWLCAPLTGKGPRSTQTILEWLNSKPDQPGAAPTPGLQLACGNAKPQQSPKVRTPQVRATLPGSDQQSPNNPTVPRVLTSVLKHLASVLCACCKCSAQGRHAYKDRSQWSCKGWFWMPHLRVTVLRSQFLCDKIKNFY